MEQSVPALAVKPIARDRLMEALACIPVLPTTCSLRRMADDAGYASVVDLRSDLETFAAHNTIKLVFCNGRTSSGPDATGFRVGVPKGWRTQLNRVVEDYIDARGDEW